MAQLAREVLAVPPELKGFVVAKPALEIPKISAKAIRDTTELRLSNKVSACSGLTQLLGCAGEHARRSRACGLGR